LLTGYTHTLRGAEAAALSAIPNYSIPAVDEAKKTGTDSTPLNEMGMPEKSGGQNVSQVRQWETTNVMRRKNENPQ
jgi:hypothetical protein